PLLSAPERQQMLVEWNRTQADYPSELCIHQLFEAQVERTPAAAAVVLGEEHLSYDALNRRANQLAHHLRKLGVGPDVPVGICVERSLEMMVAVLGILKAGGAYVPLDPGYPHERLAYMLGDARVPVLLTLARLRQRLPGEAVRFLCLDTQWPQIAEEEQTNPPPLARPDHLIYVIYTSGSTGAPKGVMISH